MAQSKHGCGFEIIERGPNNEWQTWLATCKCGERWTADNYYAVEDKWRMHVHERTGTVVPATGSQEGRWSA